MGFLDKVKGLFDENPRVLVRIQKTVDKVNALSDEIAALDDAQLRAKTDEFKEILDGGKTLDDILPEAFSVCREAADRRCTPGGTWTMFTWDDETVKKRIKDEEIRQKIREIKERVKGGEKASEIMLPASFYHKVRSLEIKGTRMRPYDVQVIGGIVLHEGNIAEMKTGEGKTLAATMPVYLNALAGNGVHVVTVNDYLAKRDKEWMGTVYEFLGMTVGVIQHRAAAESSDVRRAAYAADITYGTNNEFGFDYLRDNMVPMKEYMVQRGHPFAIVDEVDSILIDEARTPLIISGQAEQDVTVYYKVNQAVAKIINKEEFYEFDEKDHTSNLTEEGQVAVAKFLGMPDLFDWGRNFDPSTASDADNQKLQRYNEIIGIVNSSIKAYTLYKLDRDYIVKDNEVIIVDEFTGRLMYGRRYSEGLHQAIEAKEGVKIEQESQTLASITFQNYFRMYNKLGGMTGTAKTEEQEFSKIYGLNVVVIPTNLPMVRKDHPDVIFKSEKAKFNAVIEDIVESHKVGQPVLVGTVSVEKSELLSKMLLRKGVTHNVLNAKHHEREAEIVSQAGQRGQVTIATNMAGRGTDIVLGDEVPELGGLHIIGTERHESRRIDNQLRGRSGRQGDNGSSRFYLSLEDDLMRLFGSDRIHGLMERVGFTDDEPIEHPWVTKSIESAQKKVEARNFEMRKHVLEYDDVMNKQREAVYDMRREILEGEGLNEKVLDFLEKQIEYLLDRYCGAELDKQDWNIESLYEDVFNMSYRLPFGPKEMTGLSRDDLKEKIHSAIRTLLKEKRERLGDEMMNELQRRILLDVIDNKWREHLYAMDHLKDGIGLRAYGQVNPLVAYQKESFDLFEQMKDEIRTTVVRFILLLEIRVQRRQPQAVQENTDEIKSGPNLPGGGSAGGGAARHSTKNKEKVGRNDLCPCGSGKKYKRCCMDK